VARVALLCPDLLFGSKVEGALRAAGHEVSMHADPESARAAAGDAELLVVDLTVPETEGPELVGSLRAAGENVPTLGFYSHVEQDVRERAEQAGFDRVVPRSRMAREGAALVGALLGG
jgi:DNA-binding response OmpR family regulator